MIFMELVKRLIRDLFVVEVGIIIGHLMYSGDMSKATSATIFATAVLSVIMTVLFHAEGKRYSYDGNLLIRHKPGDDEDAEVVSYSFEVITPLDEVERMEDIRLRIVNAMDEE